jgi:RecB family exonuclease
MRSFAEVRFGLADRRAPVDGLTPPWPPDAPFTFPGTTLRLRGVIDRLDVSGDGTHARVTDYKTGAPKTEKALADGQEVQRVAYAAVARAHLDPAPRTEARLIYPKGPVVRALPADRMEAEIDRLGRALAAARDALAAGGAVPGEDGLDGTLPSRPLRLALPADAKAYAERIGEAVDALRADVTAAWADPDDDEEASA